MVYKNDIIPAVETGFKPVSTNANANTNANSGFKPVSTNANANTNANSGFKPVSTNTNANTNANSGFKPVSTNANANTNANSGFKPVSTNANANTNANSGFKPVSTNANANTNANSGFKPVSTGDANTGPKPYNDTKFRGQYRIASTRLPGYDYATEGAYFITICTKNRENFFGKIVDGFLEETKQSKICLDCWRDLPNHYANCMLDEFIIMPNHVHMIIFIIPAPIVETGLQPVSTGHTDTNTDTIDDVDLKTVSTVPKNHSISEIVRGFKTFTARRINEYQQTPGKPFWQTRFYDHIIRDEAELERIRTYISQNPQKWEYDKNNQNNISL